MLLLPTTRDVGTRVDVANGVFIRSAVLVGRSPIPAGGDKRGGPLFCAPAGTNMGAADAE